VPTVEHLFERADLARLQSVRTDRTDEPTAGAFYPVVQHVEEPKQREEVAVRDRFREFVDRNHTSASSESDLRPDRSGSPRPPPERTSASASWIATPNSDSDRVSPSPSVGETTRRSAARPSNHDSIVDIAPSGATTTAVPDRDRASNASSGCPVSFGPAMRTLVVDDA